MDTLRVGIVILNYNDYLSTLQLLNTISMYKSIDHIVVVDNCSTNDSYAQLKSAQNQYWDLIQTSKNNGYANGNNVGIRYLIDKYDVDIIGIANPDVCFDEKLVEVIKADFEKYEEYAILTGLQTGMRGDIHQHAFWKEMTIGRLFLSNFRILNKINDKIQNFVKKSIMQHADVFPVSTVEGCLFFIRAIDMEKIGGFDEGTFLYMEEDILTQRIKKTGKQIGIDPNIPFIHAHSTSVNQAFSYFKKIKISFESKKYFLNQYLTKSKFWNILFNLSISAAWVEQIFLLYPYFRLRTFMRNRND